MPDPNANIARETDPLTPRQREVLALLASGMPRTDVAEQLGIAPGTLRAHLTNIFRKTGAANRVQAARYYLDNLPPGLAAEATAGPGSAVDRDDENATSGDLRPEGQGRRARLSRRELQVLERVSAGATSDAIARELGLVEGTIKTHLSSIYKKTGSQNRIQAARYYLRHYGTAETAQLTNLEDDIADIKARLHELQPAVEEAQRLQDALEALQAARTAFEG